MPGARSRRARRRRRRARRARRHLEEETASRIVMALALFDRECDRLFIPRRWPSSRHCSTARASIVDRRVRHEVRALRARPPPRPRRRRASSPRGDDRRLVRPMTDRSRRGRDLLPTRRSPLTAPSSSSRPSSRPRPRPRLPRAPLVAIVLLLLLAVSGASRVRADDFDEDFAPPTRTARANANANAATAPRSRASAGGSNDDDASGAASVATTKGAGGAGRGVEDITFVLEHALAVRPGDVSDDDFAPCGVFSARAHFERSSSAADDDDVAVARLTRLQLTRDPVDASFAAAFAKLVEDDLPYRVRVPANVLHPRKGVGVMASIPARCLADAQLQENFALHADELGNVVGVDYATMGGDCAPNGEREITPLGANPVFRTTAAVRHHKTAPRLDPRAGTDVRGHGGPGAREHSLDERDSLPPRQTTASTRATRSFRSLTDVLSCSPLSFRFALLLRRREEGARRGWQRQEETAAVALHGEVLDVRAPRDVLAE